MKTVARLAFASLVAASCAPLGGGCGSSSDTAASNASASSGSGASGPTPVCKTPTAPAGPWFKDVSATVLPNGADPDARPTSTSIRAGDVDGDGYPDLLITGGEGFPKRWPATTCDGLVGGMACDPKNKGSDCPDTGKCVGANGGRRDVPGMRARNLFMNRPDASDPSGKKRIFVDATEESHISDTRDGKGGLAFGVASFGDVDNDGDLDIAVGPSDPGQAPRPSDDTAAVLLNDGKGHFALGPAGTDLERVKGYSPATCTFLDYDKDGNLDFLPGTFTYPPPNFKPPVLFQGHGDATFNDVAKGLGFPKLCKVPPGGAPTCSPNYGLTACDLDMDGDQDILFASYGREPNQVWRNDGGTFVEIGHQTGLDHDDREDFSDDQSYRCYCQNRPGTCNPEPPPPVNGICKGFGLKLCQGGHCIFNNAACSTDDDCFGDGRGWLPGDSDKPWSLGGNNYSLACADVDNDGDMDIMTSTIRHADVGSASDPSELCLNDAAPGGPLGKFRRPGAKATGIDRSAIEKGLNWNTGDLTTTMVDLDNDGMKDIYLASSDYPDCHGWVYHQKADHTFEDVTIPSAIGQAESHGLAFLDYDMDGDLDVAIGTSTARVGGHATLFFYENQIGAAQNWVQVALEGGGTGKTNRSAIGALVKVTAGGVTQMQEVQGGHSSSTTQNELVLTFGLGSACAIDKIEVRWLDATNTVATFTGVQPNYRVKIVEGKDAVEYVGVTPTK